MKPELKAKHNYVQSGHLAFSCRAVTTTHRLNLACGGQRKDSIFTLQFS